MNYKCHNADLQDYLILNGLEPVIEYGDVVEFRSGKELQTLLDRWYIERSIFKVKI
jgi:hypothetical protein